MKILEGKEENLDFQDYALKTFKDTFVSFSDLSNINPEILFRILNLYKLYIEVEYYKLNLCSYDFFLRKAIL